MNAAALRAAYGGVRVLLTGHTGFKGGWLARWLHRLGAEVHGLALPPQEPARLHTLLPAELRARERIVDVRDEAAVRAAIEAIEPALVLHLAAQALVRRSYREPALTFATNVQGTVHVLEACRRSDAFRAAVVVTTDKVYADDGGAWGYRESDRLGGHDPYAASKAACELAVASLRQSFPERLGRVATARAGNVIGALDFGEDRLVPDLVRAAKSGTQLALRRPDAMRPWQHVLEPLHGYLVMGARGLAGAPGEAWNLGPGPEGERTVAQVAALLQRAIGRDGLFREAPDPDAPHETHRLTLDATKAAVQLGVRPRLSADEAIAWTAEGYAAWLEGRDEGALLDRQLAAYEERLS